MKDSIREEEAVESICSLEGGKAHAPKISFIVDGARLKECDAEITIDEKRSSKAEKIDEFDKLER